MMRKRLHEIGASAAALAGADRSGLLHALRDQPRSADALARDLDLDLRAVRLTLSIMELDGFVERDGERYLLGWELVQELSAKWSRPGVTSGLWSGIEHLLKKGEPIVRLEPSDRGERYRDAVEYLARLFATASERFAEIVSGSIRSVLDVGAGSAIWSRALLARSSSARVTALDLPPVITVLQQLVERAGLAERFGFLGADYHEADLAPHTYELTIAANVLHLETADRAQSLLNRIARATATDGRLAIVDMLGGDTIDLARAQAAYALHLALRVPDARPHPEPELRRWLGDAGFVRIERFDLDPALPGLGVLIARRS